MPNVPKDCELLLQTIILPEINTSKTMVATIRNENTGPDYELFAPRPFVGLMPILFSYTERQNNFQPTRDYFCGHSSTLMEIKLHLHPTDNK